MSIKNIVVGIDGSSISNEVLKRAFLIAANKEINITVVHIIETTLMETFFTNKNSDEVKQELMMKIAQDVQKLNQFNANVSIRVTSGKAADQIIEKAHDLKADLIIIGANAKDDLSNKTFGSTAHNIAQKSNLPVLIVKNSCQKAYENVLAFSDLTPVSQKSIEFAKESFENATFKLVHAYKQLSDFTLSFYNAMEAKETLKDKVKNQIQESFEAFNKKVGIENTQLIEAYYNFNDVLLEASNNTENDLIVLGSHGVKDTTAFLQGSTSSFLMEHTQSDVLVYVP